MKKIYVLGIISLLLPNLVFASWWNPISWFVFEQPSQNTIVVSSSTLELSPEEIKFNFFKPSSWFKTTKSETIEVIATTTKEIESNEYNKLIEEKKVLQKSIEEKISNDEVNKLIEEKNRLKKEIEETVRAEAAIKAKEAQIAQQKIDEQIRIDTAVKAALEKQMAEIAQQKAQQEAANFAEQQAALDAANLKAQQAAQQRAAEYAANQAVIQAQNEKQSKLDTINKQVADLNMKYSNDIANVYSSAKGRDVTTAFLNAQIAQIDRQYNIDYNLLKAQYEQILYSN